MASGSGPVMDEDELKGDGKKRKFKPLEAVRKLFGKSKRKAKDEQVSVVAVKAKSTSALHHSHDDDEDDDDGGFKNRQPRPLGGNRSISEDSIFSPEQREPNLQALKKAAVSEESLPKSAFQAELFSKLSKRRSQYSDEDDGLPHSPTPPVTTADIIMGGPLKPLPAAGKSTSRESDNSLISNDASENEEDDPFQSQWKSSVPSKVNKKTSESGGGAEAPIDFEKVGQTELLKSNIAKDRISIKPRSRKANRQSRKQREGQSPHSLPSLNEESPPKSRGEPTATTSAASESPVDSARQRAASSSSVKPEGSPVEKAPGVSSHLQLRPSSDSSPTKRRPVSTPVSASMVSAFTIAQEQKREASKEEDKGAGLKPDIKSPTLKEGARETSVKVSSAAKEDVKEISMQPEVQQDPKRVGLKSDLKSPTVREYGVAKSSVDAAKSETQSESRPKFLSTSKTMESLKKESDSDNSSVMSKSMSSVTSSKTSSMSEPSSSNDKRKVDFLSSSMKSSEHPSSPHSPAPHGDSKPGQVFSSTVKTPTDRASPPVTSKPRGTGTSPAEGKKDGLRPTDTHGSPAFSPKDDYKLRRQNRSKTLPEQPISKEEPFAAKVQRTASHRADPTSSQNASPESSPRHKEKVPESPKTKEPEWFALARRKTGRQESEEKDSPSPTNEATPAKENPVFPGPVSPTPAPKDESACSVTETSRNMGVSVASSKFDRFAESKPSEVSRFRGGSVKTSPTKTHVLAGRVNSVKVQSARSESGTATSSSASPSVTTSSSLKTSSVSSVSASSSASGAKQDEVKEEPKVSESSPLKEVPKWKTQSVKTPSVFSSGSSSAVSTSRFGSMKVTSQTTSAPVSSPGPKTDTKAVSSPVRTAAFGKTPAEEKEKQSVPAWRANLSQKKPASSDIKIELIENTSSKPSGVSVGSKKEESAKKEETVKKEESATKPLASASKEVPSDLCRSSAAPSRNSKVMNLLKNFENVQGVS